LTDGSAPGVQTAVTGLPIRRSVGPGLDHLIRLLPPGGAHEFVRGLPRRVTKEELLADLEALVRLLQVEELRR
jgi:hypothetical protein